MAKIEHEVAQTERAVKDDERKGGKVTLEMGEVPAVGTKERELLDLRAQIKAMQVRICSCWVVCVYVCVYRSCVCAEKRTVHACALFMCGKSTAADRTAVTRHV